MHGSFCITQCAPKRGDLNYTQAVVLFQNSKIVEFVCETAVN